jgi:hypothetical protein
MHSEFIYNPNPKCSVCSKFIISRFRLFTPSRRLSFFERERQKICHSNILEEIKNYKQTQPEKLNNKDLDRTLTLKGNDPKKPLNGTPAATDRLHLHQRALSPPAPFALSFSADP